MPTMECAQWGPISKYGRYKNYGKKSRIQSEISLTEDSSLKFLYSG